MTASTTCQLQNQLALLRLLHTARQSPCRGITGQAILASPVIAWFDLLKGANPLRFKISAPA